MGGEEEKGEWGGMWELHSQIPKTFCLPLPAIRSPMLSTRNESQRIGSWNSGLPTSSE